MFETTRLIVGIGNPGAQYDGTRHNIGFALIDQLARMHGISVTRSSGRALIGDGLIGRTRVFLMKPQTFVNLTGEALGAFLRQKTLSPNEVLVVADDIHLDPGKMRIRLTGSDGGHNGLKSVAAHLRSRDYPRLRIGVGSPADPAHQIDYVLGRFSRAEQIVMQETLDRAVAAAEVWVQEGGETAMNRFNG